MFFSRQPKARDKRLSSRTASHGRGAIFFCLALILICLAASPSIVFGQQIAKRGTTGGFRIRVNLPLTGSADQLIKQMVQRVVEQQSDGPDRGVLVLEFWPAAGTEGRGTEFERALSLARYLTSANLQRVRTVAYVPRAAIGHAVLVALACEEIIMDPDAVLGDAGIDESVIGPTMRGGYTEIARSRRTIPEAMALGMLDAELQISRVTTGSGVLYVWGEELAKLKQERQDLRAIDTLIPAGQMGRFRGDELRELGFVSYLASSREELANALQIPAQELEFDPSLGGKWRPIRVDLNGPVTTQMVERVMRSIQQQREMADTNFVCLQIDSAGGSPRDSVRLANFLADLDQSRIRTVAYITEQARGDAVLLALACDHTVVHPDAILGGSGAATIGAEVAADLRGPIREIADRKSRNWSLVTAMFDPDLEVYSYQRAGTDDPVYLSTEEFAEKYGEAADPVDQPPDNEEAEQPDAVQWVRGPAVTQPGQVLEVNGRDAAERLGVARYLAEDLGQLQQLYQLERMPDAIRPNWAFEFIDALASPQLAEHAAVYRRLRIDRGVILARHRSGWVPVGDVFSAVFLEQLSSRDSGMARGYALPGGADVRASRTVCDSRLRCLRTRWRCVGDHFADSGEPDFRVAHE